MESCSRFGLPINWAGSQRTFLGFFHSSSIEGIAMGEVVCVFGANLSPMVMNLFTDRLGTLIRNA